MSCFLPSFPPALGLLCSLKCVARSLTLAACGLTLVACNGPVRGHGQAVALATETEALAADPSSVMLRTRLAMRLADQGHPDTARELLLAGLQEATSSADRVRLQQALASLLARSENFRAAAESLEMAAGGVHPVGQPAPDGAEQPAADDRRALLELASRYQEQAGAPSLALRDLEAALAGMPLSESEERLLARLRAFQGVELEHPADAVALLKSHPDPARRLAAIEFLVTQEFRRAVDVFALALLDPDPRVVRIALQQVGRRGEAMDAVLIHPWLAHESRGLRLAALKAVARLGSEESVPLLIENLDPSDRAAFRIANKALENLTGEIMGDDLDPDLEQRTRLIEAWRAWWQPPR